MQQADDSVIQSADFYSIFAVFGLFGGTLVNKLSVKLTLSFRVIGYCIYTISLLVAVHEEYILVSKFWLDLFSVCALVALFNIC